MCLVHVFHVLFWPQVSSIVVKRQTMSHMEKDMERWLRQRESLGKKLERFLKKKERALVDNNVR